MAFGLDIFHCLNQKKDTRKKLENYQVTIILIQVSQFKLQVYLYMFKEHILNVVHILRSLLDTPSPRRLNIGSKWLKSCRLFIGRELFQQVRQPAEKTADIVITFRYCECKVTKMLLTLIA